MIPGLILLIFFHIVFLLSASAQTETENQSGEELWENLAEKNDAEPENDEAALDLQDLAVHRLNLNGVNAEELSRLHMLNPLQVRNFISYRSLLGPLISIHELQAVPGWDLETIHDVLPYVVVRRDESLYSALRERWNKGESSLLFRASQTLEKSKGFLPPVTSTASFYEGSAQKIFLRYTYHFQQLLLYGFTAEKDAGEPFLRSAQRYGFDFYSFHFFMRQNGLLRAVALGDFAVNFGQGLIQWQGLAFSKSSQVLSIRREGESIRPYRSAGEYNFHRGIAVSLQRGRWQSNLFLSYQYLSVHAAKDSTDQDVFSSFQESGYHRTASEEANRNNAGQFSAGGNLRYSGAGFQLGINAVHFIFSRSLQKAERPYALYALKGKSLTDISVDYSYSFYNLYLFGEMAKDIAGKMATIQGALLSVDERISLSFLYRNIPAAFHSLYSNAFTESSKPVNEEGFFSGLQIKFGNGLLLNAYHDRYSFPWLRYRVDAPSSGRDWLIGLEYGPSKSWKVSIIYKNSMKPVNGQDQDGQMPQLVYPVRQRWRMVSESQISRSLTFRFRAELVRITGAKKTVDHGFLGSLGLRFARPHSSFTGGIEMFETDDYASRIYMYEPDLLYAISLPVFYGRGLHYFVGLQGDAGRLRFLHGGRIHITGWLKWEQGFYPGVVSIGSGLDEIMGNHRSMLKIQWMVLWR